MILEIFSIYTYQGFFLHLSEAPLILIFPYFFSDTTKWKSPHQIWPHNGYGGEILRHQTVPQSAD